MTDESQIKFNKIKDLILEASAKPEDMSGIVLIRESVLVQILSSMPIDALQSALAPSPIPEVSETDAFRAWMTSRRQQKNLSQTELANQLGIRPEQINRFEKKKRPLETSVLSRIKSLLA